MRIALLTFILAGSAVLYFLLGKPAESTTSSPVSLKPKIAQSIASEEIVPEKKQDILEKQSGKADVSAPTISSMPIAKPKIVKAKSESKSEKKIVKKAVSAPPQTLNDNISRLMKAARQSSPPKKLIDTTQVIKQNQGAVSQDISNTKSKSIDTNKTVKQTAITVAAAKPQRNLTKKSPLVVQGDSGTPVGSVKKTKNLTMPTVDRNQAAELQAEVNF